MVDQHKPIDFNRVRAALDKAVEGLVVRVETGDYLLRPEATQMRAQTVIALSLYLESRTRLMPVSPRPVSHSWMDEAS